MGFSCERLVRLLEMRRRVRVVGWLVLDGCPGAGVAAERAGADLVGAVWRLQVSGVAAEAVVVAWRQVRGSGDFKSGVVVEEDEVVTKRAGRGVAGVTVLALLAEARDVLAIARGCGVEVGEVVAGAKRAGVRVEAQVVERLMDPERAGRAPSREVLTGVIAAARVLAAKRLEEARRS